LLDVSTALRTVPVPSASVAAAPAKKKIGGTPDAEAVVRGDVGV
jgi:hypothetical protein